jgi:ketosteroid isomerase-like protein
MSTRGQHEGGRRVCEPYGQVLATGAAYANRYISVLTIEERKVIRWRDYLDPLAVFDALGWPDAP